MLDQLNLNKNKNKILLVSLLVLMVVGLTFFAFGAPRAADGLQWEHRDVDFWTIHSQDRRFWHRDAEKYCQQLTLDGYYDWRLPKVEELKTLLQVSAKHRRKVAQVDRAIYWTATPYDEMGQRYWTLSFLSEQAAPMEEHNYNTVVCVRAVAN
ncbi:MAG: DUF1566 domain-containing protein [Desulfuromonas sp.]|nr:DUF1566 domain-containing protein [Desulfuromonas sp.]